jgi:hypothetical protein
MDYVVRRIAEAIASGSPRERLERAALAFLTYVKDHPDGFAVLVHNAPVASARGGMSSLLNDVAVRAVTCSAPPSRTRATILRTPRSTLTPSSEW